MIITENSPHPPDVRDQESYKSMDTQAQEARDIEALDVPVHREMVVIIRPSFKKLCDQDACRAAILNHLLYWIARRARGLEEDAIRSGEVYWYGSYEDICHTGLADSWGMSKIRKEIRALVKSGLIGQRHNPVRGFDREYHYFFGNEQGKALKALCEQHGINLIELGLQADVLHLLKITHACVENDGCIRYIQHMHSVKTTDASVENNRAIPKDSTKITAKDSPKRGDDANPMEATSVAALAPTISSNGVEASQIVEATVVTQEQRTSSSERPEMQTPVPPPVTTPPTAEGTSGKASNQRKQSNATGKSSDKPKTSRSKSTTLSSAASLLLDAWDEINGRPLTRTKEQVQAAEELARINAIGDDLRNVRERLLSQKDGFWKARGVSLKNVANNFHLAALGPLQQSDGSRANASQPTQSVARPVQTASVPADRSQPRKLLRRVPAATQAELPVGTSQEARVAQ